MFRSLKCFGRCIWTCGGVCVCIRQWQLRDKFVTGNTQMCNWGFVQAKHITMSCPYFRGNIFLGDFVSKSKANASLLLETFEELIDRYYIMLLLVHQHKWPMVITLLWKQLKIYNKSVLYSKVWNFNIT